MMRKSFAIELWADGSAACAEISTAPPGSMSLLTWNGSTGDRVHTLLEVLARAKFDSWPDRVGEGKHEVELWIRSDDGRVVRRTLRVAFDGDYPRVDPEAERFVGTEIAQVVAIVDEIVEAVRGSASGRPKESPELAFPSSDDRRARRRCLRFTETHDWDGSTAYTQLLDVRLSDNGLGERRQVDTSGGGYRITNRNPFKKSEQACASLFARLEALDFGAIRRRAGGGALDTTYTQRVEYFDGVRLRDFEYMWTRERGLGVSDGSNPPNEAERALLDLATALARR